MAECFCSFYDKWADKRLKFACHLI